MRVLRLCSVYESPSRSHAFAAGFDVIGGMQIHTARLTAALDARGIEQVVITALRPAAPRNQPVGERSRVVRAGVPIRRLRQLYGLAAIPEVIRTGSVDVVHVHVGEDLAIIPLAAWAASRVRAALVVTLHNSLGYTLERRDLRSTILDLLGGPAEARLVRAADAVLVLSDGSAARLHLMGIARSRVRVVPLGIDLDALRQPLPRPAAMDGRRWIVYAGRLVPEKGVRDLVAAFAALGPTDAGLMIVGEGPDRAALTASARRDRSADRIRFVGPIPHPSIPAYLQHADVVVLPSWTEERGRILLEAMAAGTPVVATFTGGIPATVRDGVNGTLVPPRNPERLAAAIDRVLRDGRLSASMIEAGRTTASEHGVEALADVTLATYEAVLDRTEHPPRKRGFLVRSA